MPYEFVGRDKANRKHYVHDDPSLGEPDIFRSDEEDARLNAGLKIVMRQLPAIMARQRAEARNELAPILRALPSILARHREQLNASLNAGIPPQLQDQLQAAREKADLLSKTIDMSAPEEQTESHRLQTAANAYELENTSSGDFNVEPDTTI